MLIPVALESDPMNAAPLRKLHFYTLANYPSPPSSAVAGLMQVPKAPETISRHLAQRERAQVLSSIYTLFSGASCAVQFIQQGCHPSSFPEQKSLASPLAPPYRGPLLQIIDFVQKQRLRGFCLEENYGRLIIGGKKVREKCICCGFPSADVLLFSSWLA